MQKVKPVPLEKMPTNNAVRRLRWLRKRYLLEKTPNVTFPLNLYV
ncbi:hypothetical protein QPK14_03515 [Photorhabdus temperata subsp. temperata]|uniref:Uncharacterized protein n=1 Tax=Photorhabdus temperata subsp. temperata Meg1 TaxID=1393735 RepID=A0A081RVZ3_PHOTE|nr:hypothetical protein MEG1DRAFT_02575 [Photorhabdus temperata subsp. temperata Meg1]